MLNTDHFIWWEKVGNFGAHLLSKFSAFLGII